MAVGVEPGLVDLLLGLICVYVGGADGDDGT
ncbi:hypothetical protein BH18ACT2_BH18ACT2_03340 [soil metagenome]